MITTVRDRPWIPWSLHSAAACHQATTEPLLRRSVGCSGSSPPNRRAFRRTAVLMMRHCHTLPQEDYSLHCRRRRSLPLLVSQCDNADFPLAQRSVLLGDCALPVSRRVASSCAGHRQHSLCHDRNSISSWCSQHASLAAA